jgi:hypothetical protein
LHHADFASLEEDAVIINSKLTKTQTDFDGVQGS